MMVFYTLTVPVISYTEGEEEERSRVQRRGELALCEFVRQRKKPDLKLDLNL